MTQNADSKFIWMDGKLVAYDDATVPFLSHSLHYGTAAFEGIRAYQMADGGTAIFRAEDHYKQNPRLYEPSVDHKDYIFAREAFLAEKRDEAIKLLRQDMDAGLKANRDNMLLRLGQLYAEKYMELSYDETQVFTKQIGEWETKKKTDKNAAKPVNDNGRSQKYLKDALALFYNLEKDYPRHAKIDEIIFFIGFVEMESGNAKKGLAYLERLIRQYPRSRKYDEAVVYLADQLFDSHRFREAMGKYRILLSRQDSSLYHYAFYKVAWCELNTYAGKKALADMKGLIAALEGSQDKAKFNLREQAIKDLVVFYGEVGNVDEAFAYFNETVGKDKALENLKLIADILRSKAQDEQAVRAYTRLLREFGDSPEAPKIWLGLYESASRLGRPQQATNDLIQAIEKYGPNSDWAKAQPPEKAADVKATQETLAAEAETVANLSGQVGAVLQKMHQRKMAELIEQREQANYLKVEIVTGEKELIEGQKGLPPKRIVDVETSVAAGYRFWPFVGEYWDDELGTYVYTTESACVN